MKFIKFMLDPGNHNIQFCFVFMNSIHMFLIETLRWLGYQDIFCNVKNPPKTCTQMSLMQRNKALIFHF